MNGGHFACATTSVIALKTKTLGRRHSAPHPCSHAACFRFASWHRSPYRPSLASASARPVARDFSESRHESGSMEQQCLHGEHPRTAGRWPEGVNRTVNCSENSQTHSMRTDRHNFYLEELVGKVRFCGAGTQRFPQLHLPSSKHKLQTCSYDSCWRRRRARLYHECGCFWIAAGALLWAIRTLSMARSSVFVSSCALPAAMSIVFTTRATRHTRNDPSSLTPAVETRRAETPRNDLHEQQCW